MHKLPAFSDLTPPPAMPKPSPLLDAATLADAISRKNDAGQIVATVLDGLSERFGYTNLLLFLLDASRGVLIPRGSRGYERAGAGPEMRLDDGPIGAVAPDGRPVDAADMTDGMRPADTARPESDDGDLSGVMSWPSLPDIMSRIGVPIIVQGKVTGVLLAESRERLAFGADDKAVMTIIACQAGASLALADALAAREQVAEDRTSSDAPVGRGFRVSYHTLDDSIFIDNEYLIKGVAGRLLMFMLDAHQREGRIEFTNRELRLSATMRLPQIKDNLDTRLLLLRRRLEEKGAPIRIVRVGRGRIHLQLFGLPLLDRVEI
ncbi:GAF domain-containing protein [Microvirga lotononidis]|uniref:GAF domain-containing protein n=1 Tax=Microvirga lotononidis TaxID=864069 RepID=I4YP97_9HYPH|nr:GAF domain-containing protein [Microvirga lotononidis]EIM25789.1 GAF domain-containing protein [Microvirga lotononidis]WQO25712.1 GAF domain-containing protein [Microvirga lotononidis]